ncbi:hypothetical protein Z948_2498 [Sulfitobacter donghicola DSW-25 = KCTC 12864 = JCM 14565]|nr:hypothetical protein Z948_2498 [Sulfitobacter donghicola DSW-25 = KCTC 12864 = JCM 14565]
MGCLTAQRAFFEFAGGGFCRSCAARPLVKAVGVQRERMG